MLTGKKILLAVTGSIAAYKTASLTRLLIKAGAEVQIVMTDAATKFITPLTLSTLSKRSVYSSVTSEEGWNNHVELGLWADAMLVAPATANTLAAMANGFCNNMVLATYLSSRCPVFFAPAMDLDMFTHPATLANIEKLKSYGNILIDAEEGELASGLVGKGRMAEPEHIVEALELHFMQQGPQPLKGLRAILTSGPTVEAIDPVRYITNHSTGKMGTAIADTLAKLGADVTLISGPVKVKPKHPAVKIIDVKSAQEMYEAAISAFPQAHIAVLAAAVADYTPEHVACEKIKKKDGDPMRIDLCRTKDIAQELGKIKTDQQCMVGFALETQNFRKNASKKLEKKNFDFIVLNSLRDQGAGFGHDTNKVTFIDRQLEIEEHELKSKLEVAEDIAAKICKLLQKKAENAKELTAQF
ncbi:bifunctional phosphopantothenoylcysteine decarboxylase/phosphopantothenate--cysteine ligase CoaBC [Saprospira sp. CCB-QB6]|uniref:bifunctional phosphopantothenoylcysteine decarboxylase/phosphopantothenate--cysteine ligase CoaBC n=1 Tax=Saprospira sp. CCB-QB6 TaxID=3023936 RepID=UPI00234AB4CC|nr:bifunctional phosphopantothenoylcysteine decarboxylase/phosphopantothenate--cysteine ligase CoaBC [Saprospira sp. CCB-QB6]WCL80262.1 bifunctional phosphopantothenoylcysteine decarboxylase/phosphopantothenate--cysteine ligase CoaBC [Saprospira sp. CCB-QB6]